MTMTSLTSKLIRSSPRLLLSAGLLLQAQILFAAEPVDMQATARAFLNPPVATHLKSVESGTALYADASEQARAFIVGKRDTAGAPVASSARDAHRGSDYPQEAVQRMILGQGSQPAGSTDISVSESFAGRLR
jgi:hypothetical protein